MKIIYRQCQDFGQIIIRRLLYRDWEQLHVFINTISQERIYSLFQGEYFPETEQQSFVKQSLAEMKKNREIFLVMYCDEKLIGIATLEKKDYAQNHLATLGILIDRDFRSLGLGTLLLKYLLQQAKLLLGIKIVTAEVFQNNHQAVQLYKNYGFVVYGVLPKGLKYRNRYQDCLLLYKKL